MFQPLMFPASTADVMMCRDGFQKSIIWKLPVATTAGVPTRLVLPIEPVVVTRVEETVTAGVVILVAVVPVVVVFTLFVATTAGVPTLLVLPVVPVVVTRVDVATTAGVVHREVVVPDTFTTTVPACEPAEAVDTGGTVAPLLLYVAVCVACGLL